MPKDKNSEKICVVGAGLMGSGIAHAFASAGFNTSLVDTNAGTLRRAAAAIEKILSDGVELGKVEPSAAASAMLRLRPVEDLAQGAADADLVIETVVEDLSVKRGVVATASQVMQTGGVIATNTSALSVTEIARGASDTGRIIGMHFFNPVHKMKLVEIVLGLETNERALTLIKEYCAAIGKVSIVVNETPGLTTSRMSAMAGNEAMYMLMEGAASAEDIDTAMRLGFNHPMGPLELGDLTGWDTRLSVLKYLHATLGDKFRPCPLIAKMVAAGRLGRKTGAGVYV